MAYTLGHTYGCPECGSYDHLYTTTTVQQTEALYFQKEDMVTDNAQPVVVKTDLVGCKNCGWTTTEDVQSSFGIKAQLVKKDAIIWDLD